MPWSWVDHVAATPKAPPQIHSLMISAGHDHRDPGVVDNGYSEADIVLELRDRLSRALKQRGVAHLRDGNPGENLPLREAVKLAATCDIAVEFHCNGAESDKATGVETLSRRENFPLAGRIASTMARVQGLRNRGSKPEGAGQHHRLAFVSGGGGIIAELFFLTNIFDLRAYLERRDALVEELADLLSSAVRSP